MIRPWPACHHVRHDVLGGQEAAAHIGGEHVIPLLDRRLVRRPISGAVAARRVHQNVDAAEARDRGVDRLLDVALLADVRRKPKRFAAARRDLIGGRAARDPRTRSQSATRAPSAANFPRRDLADTAASAGDEHDLAGEGVRERRFVAALSWSCTVSTHFGMKLLESKIALRQRVTTICPGTPALVNGSSATKRCASLRSSVVTI